MTDLSLTVPSDDVSFVLLRAAELLRRDGRCTCHYGPLDPRHRGPRCVSGAIVAASHDLPGLDTERQIRTEQAAKFRLKSFIQLRPHLALTEWNDRRTVTDEEVLAALEGAA